MTNDREIQDIANSGLEAPHMWKNEATGEVWADADELRAWRLQHTSQDEHG